MLMDLTPKNDSGGGMVRTKSSSELNIRKPYKSLDGLNEWFIDKRGIYKLLPSGDPDWGNARQCSELPMSGIEGGRHQMEEQKNKLLCVNPAEMYSKFLWFINEREEIRRLKEAGMPRPWTCDEVLHRTRFTNIFRTDDKVSKLIYERTYGLQGLELVYNLLLSRLINRTDTLNKILPSSMNDDLSYLLEGDAAVLNAAAYQLSPGLVNKSKYTTVREIVMYETKYRCEPVFDALTSTRDMNEAVVLGNKAYGGSIPFTIFQVVLDYQHLTGHYNIPNTIRIGQGAEAVFGVLGDAQELTDKLNGEVSRQMMIWDVEHAACEFRKYLHRQGKNLSRYSYKENSMGIIR